MKRFLKCWNPSGTSNQSMVKDHKDHICSHSGVNINWSVQSVMLWSAAAARLVDWIIASWIKAIHPHGGGTSWTGFLWHKIQIKTISRTQHWSMRIMRMCNDVIYKWIHTIIFIFIAQSCGNFSTKIFIFINEVRFYYTSAGQAIMWQEVSALAMRLNPTSTLHANSAGRNQSSSL